MNRMMLLTFAAALCACGSSNNNNNGGGGTPDSGSGHSITISNLTYSPSELTVSAGETITLVNNDSTDHSVTSEAADNDLSPGGVSGVTFDVSIPPSTGGTGGGPYGGGSGSTPGTATLTIPSSAASGTVIPFYCRFHTTMMNPVNGHLTVR